MSRLAVRARRRRVRLWWCRRRGHPVEHPVAMRFEGAATLLADGTIQPGQVYEQRATVCARCDR